MTLSLRVRESAITFRDPGTGLALIWILLEFVNARILHIRAHISMVVLFFSKEANVPMSDMSFLGVKTNDFLMETV